MTTFPEYNLHGSNTIDKFFATMHTSNSTLSKADWKTIESDLFKSTTTSRTKPSSSHKKKFKMQAFLKESSSKDKKSPKSLENSPTTTPGKI